MTIQNYYNTLKSTVNEATQIAQQGESLRMQAMNVAQGPLNLVSQVQSTVGAYTNLLQEASTISYNINAVAKQFETTFDPGNVKTPGEMIAKARTMMRTITQAGKIAAETQAIYEKLCLEMGMAAQAASTAASAEGAVQVGQAQAQQLLVMSGQLKSLQEQAAAADRVQTGFVMLQVKEREQGLMESEHWLEGYGDRGWTGPKQGRGIILP
jgi:P-type conjugative transfer protein TrbJ